MVDDPYERVMLAGTLLDMTEKEAAKVLNRKIDPMTADDLLAMIEGFAEKVRAIKAKAGGAVHAG